MLKPKEFTLQGKKYILSKFPASEGRDIMVQYGLSAIPKLGNYGSNREMADRMLSFVAAVTQNGEQVRLTTVALIDNHVESWVDRMQLEAAMAAYNFDPLHDGRISTFLEEFAQNLQAWTSQTLTESLGQLFPKVKHLFTNSEPSTP